MISSGINLVMTIIGFSVSTMFIVFVCTRLICARIHLSAYRRSFRIASRSDLSILERGLHGLEPVAVANFPTKKYGDEFFSATEDPQCTVCLAEYNGEDIVRILPYCGHFFHATCIDIWLHQHSTCPVCRVSLRELPEKKRLMQPLFSSAIRSSHSLQAFDIHTYHCLMSRHTIPSRHHGSEGMNLAEEDRNGAEDGQNTSPATEGGQSTKDAGNKHVESVDSSEQ